MKQAVSAGHHHRMLHLVFAVAACWPLGPWLTERWLHWQGMFLSFLLFGIALGVWAYLLRQETESQPRRVSPRWQLGATLAMTAYVLLYYHIPISLAYTIVTFGFICILMGMLPQKQRGRSLGLVPLVMLSLPVMPSIEYVFGYPLRALVAEIASIWLGGEIIPVGTGLTDGVNTVFVDAPCSGLRMLSTSILLSAGSALALRLSNRRTCMLLLLGIVVALVGNTIRAVTLFVLETRIANSGVAHSATGIIIFAGCAGLLVWFALLLRHSDMPPADVDESRPQWLLHSVFLLSCLAALAVPFFSTSDRMKEGGDVTFKWPETWNGETLVPIKVDPGLKDFLEDFPGKMAAFRVGNRCIFLRWTPVATRKLHTAAGCYRATGYRIMPLPALKDEYGHIWSRFRASHPNGKEVTVRECYFSIPLQAETQTLEQLTDATTSWPDASSWYWAAALPGSQVRATLAVTVTEE